jgi:signal transduction histidine kinase
VRLPSIRSRLARSLMLWVVAWGLGVALAVGLAAQHEVDELLDESLALARYEPLPPGTPLAPATHAELQAVQDAITALGRRLSQRVASERAFTAHAAHALRTPLAGIDTQLAVALREAPPALQARLAARARRGRPADARGVGAAGAVPQRRAAAVAGGRRGGACWRGCRTRG